MTNNKKSEIENKLTRIIKFFFPKLDNYEQITFIFEFDDKQENINSGIDEMLSFWALPSIYGKAINYKSVLKNLENRDKIPLWIKTSIRFEKQIILQISKRFKGTREINKFHKSNPLQPFILVDSSKDVTAQTLERLFSRRQLFDYEIAFLKQQQLTIEKICEILSKNFEKTRFYPNKFLLFSPIKASYEGVIIEENYDKSYSIHEQIKNECNELIMLPDRKFENQEDAIREYIKYFPAIFDLDIIAN
jgi:hypothetical protein